MLAKARSVLPFEHGCEQFVLALKVVVERPLRQAGRLGDLVDADAPEPFPVKEFVSGLQDALSG
jgi:hypothetical protein